MRVNGEIPVMKLRETDFVRTLRASVADLLDELLTFVTFLAALFAGLYFGSWFVFGAILIAGFLSGILVRQLVLRQRSG
ncbi:uncharacterized protein sS8_2324 [Methylocaldum marinum]|uniref:Uncharacterized protein n=1 Tax=Methylocaldum marinum TaxID=1432792 RepID=A0A250KRV0_9GAMM|nr:uncharacterized protein sS8_2324 [Methylocaldum marinum]